MRGSLKMKLEEAIRRSDCKKVRWGKGEEKFIWTLCRNYDGDIDFIANTGGGWLDIFLSQYYDPRREDFEPVMRDELDEHR
jgi:hypothetical protein